MKIGIDCRLYSPKFTGIGRYTKELVEHIIKINEREGYPHEIVLFFNNPEYKKYDPPKNVRKVLVNARHYSFAEQWQLFFKIRKEKLDRMHFPHFNVPILYRRPYTVTIHDTTLTHFPIRKFTKIPQRLAYNMIIKNAVRTAKKVVAVSQNTKDDIINFLKIPSKKIQVVHNGVDKKFKFLHDTKEIEPTLKKYNITKQVLLYTGLWRHHKNLVRAIKAFAILKKEKDLDMEFVITGNEKKKYPEIQRAVKKEELEDDVIFPGFVSEEELMHLYNAAMIYVFPSLYEGFGFPPLESMLCGTPVVASNASSIPEICSDAALYFDPYSVEDIANKIEMLYKDADLQADFVKKGIVRANEFSWEKMTDETYKIIIGK